MSPLEVNCPHQNPDLTNCGAIAGQPCNWQETTSTELYHFERLEVAEDISTPGNGYFPTDSELDKAIEGSELI
jgi:hypothetical protein